MVQQNHQLQNKLPGVGTHGQKRDRKAAGLPIGPECDGIPGNMMGHGMQRSHQQLGFKAVPQHSPPPNMSPLGMYDTYQPWVQQTYGDSAKTKTITRNKYQRILQILRGDYIDNETSKFKLWCKGRGFRIGPPPGYIPLPPTDPDNGASIQLTALTAPMVPPNTPINVEYNADKDPHPDIYVQTGTVKNSEGQDRICYKKVAVVEEFFDIIYNLHVCKDGKDKKHMGQKRTYRAVSERYAFVPREAVTKFLVLCTECPRRSSVVQLSLNTVS
ncbi:unnamed protein product, partial [Meganyctiphanes norvegica]